MQASEFLGVLRYGQRFGPRAAHAQTAQHAAQHAFVGASSALARPKPIARTRLQHPVAVCTRCNVFSFDADSIGERCSRAAAARPCPGVFALSRNTREWQKCDDCVGTGWHAAMVCMQCQSLGWRFFRKT